MQLYVDYCKEMYDRDVIFNDKSFVSYKYFEDGSLYVHSLFTSPEHRRSNQSLSLLNTLLEKYSPSVITCYVDVTTNNPNLSLQLLLQQGFKIYESSPTAISLVKECI